MSNVNPFPKQNIPAYLTVMGTMVLMSVLLWAVYLFVKNGTFDLAYFSTFKVELAFSFLMVMSGMMIMFVASLVNLRKMKKGWEAVAQGQKNVKIPEVWCPVLTSAKQAAEELVKKVNPQSIN